MAKGTLVILGSGEIAPGMVKIYRDLLGDLEPRVGVMLDTPFGFQENVPQLTAKIIDYFDTSLHVDMTSASFLRAAGTTALERERYLAAIRHSPFVFAGPGSPSYAMRQWATLPLVDALIDVLDANGVVCFSSAAALTLGESTAPIYELYKVGDDPYWLEGLNLLDHVHLRCAVIPHFDNAEGGNHDTRFCYLGERRLLALESLLAPGVATLGVDEHTAVIISLADDSLTVRGRGQAYWRTNDGQRTLERDQTVVLDSLRTTTSVARAAPPSAPREPDELDTLGHLALAGGPDAARAVAELVRRADSGGENHIDPAVLVDGVLHSRASARASGQYALADELRDVLIAAGIEVHDGPSGVSWSLRTP